MIIKMTFLGSKLDNCYHIKTEGPHAQLETRDCLIEKSHGKKAPLSVNFVYAWKITLHPQNQYFLARHFHSLMKNCFAFATVWQYNHNHHHQGQRFLTKHCNEQRSLQ
jgi:hypothetical protein